LPWRWTGPGARSSRRRNYQIVITREVIWEDEDGNGVKTVREYVVTRAAIDIINESVETPSGTMITAKQVLEALPLFFDRWAEESK
jgi:hypothetical protein